MCFNDIKMKKINSVFGAAAFIIIGVSTFLVLSGNSMATAINEWQAGVMGGHEYFPVLSICLLALPLLLVLLLIKKIIIRKNTKREG